MSSTRVTCPAHNSKATLTTEAREAKRALRLGSNCAWAAKERQKGQKAHYCFSCPFCLFLFPPCPSSDACSPGWKLFFFTLNLPLPVLTFQSDAITINP